MSELYSIKINGSTAKGKVDRLYSFHMTVNDEIVQTLLNEELTLQGFCGSLQEILRDYRHNFQVLESWVYEAKGKIEELSKMVEMIRTKQNVVIDRLNAILPTLQSVTNLTNTCESQIRNIENFLVKTFK